MEDRVIGYDPANPKGHYNNDLKVPQSVIDQIVEMGMAEALKAAQSPDASPEFVEGVNRFFPNEVAQQGQDAIGESMGSSQSAPRTSVFPTQEEGDPSVSAAEPSGGGIAAQLSPSAINRRFTDNAMEKGPGMLDQLMGGSGGQQPPPVIPGPSASPAPPRPGDSGGGLSETLGNIGGAVGQGMDYAKEGYDVMRGAGDRAIDKITSAPEDKLAQLLKGMLQDRGHM